MRLVINLMWISSYVWCGNNPVRNVDIDGRDWFTSENENKGENDRAFNDIMKIISGTDIPITLPSNTFVLAGDKDKEKDGPIINIDPKKKKASVDDVLLGGAVLKEIGDAVVSLFSKIGAGIISMSTVSAAGLISLVFLKGDTDPQERGETQETYDGQQENSKVHNNDEYKEHDKNARPSTENQHQKGKARKARDRGGEKGDVRRDPPRKKPNNWNGPWPPR